jgi:methylmalonyl-CoA/ethylmalonyl-CoA epimerase
MHGASALGIRPIPFARHRPLAIVRKTASSPRPPSPDGAAMDVTRIDQVAIAVEDLDAALEFYASAFGITPVSRHRSEVDGVDEAMLDVGGVYLQLLQPTREDSPVGRFLARSGPGLHHIGFAVRSVGDALDHLRTEGVQVIDEAPRPSGDGTHEIAFVHPTGTGGVLVELVEDIRVNGHGHAHEDVTH